MVGRGEFVRLMFEAAGVPFIDHDSSEVMKFVKGGENNVSRVYKISLLELQLTSYVIFCKGLSSICSTSY